MSEQVQQESAAGAQVVDPLSTLTQKDWDWLYNRLGMVLEDTRDLKELTITKWKAEPALEAYQLHSCMLFMNDFYSRLEHTQSVAPEVGKSLHEGLSPFFKDSVHKKNMRSLNLIMATNAPTLLRQNYSHLLKAPLHQADIHLMPSIKAQLTIAWIASLEGKALAPLLIGDRSPKVIGAEAFILSADFRRVLSLATEQLREKLLQLSVQVDRALDLGSIGLPITPAAGCTIPVGFLKPLRPLLSESSGFLEESVNRALTGVNDHLKHIDAKAITCTDLREMVTNKDELSASLDELLADITTKSIYKEMGNSLKTLSNHIVDRTLGGYLAVQHKAGNPGFDAGEAAHLVHQVDMATGIAPSSAILDNTFVEEAGKLNKHVIKTCQDTIDRIDALIYSSRMKKHPGEVLRARMVTIRIMPNVEHARAYLKALEDPAVRQRSNEQFTKETVDFIKGWVIKEVYKTNAAAIQLVEEKTGEAGMNIKTEEALAAIKANRRNTKVKAAVCLMKGAKEGAVEVQEKPTDLKEEETKAEVEEEDEEGGGEGEEIGGDKQPKPKGKKKKKKKQKKRGSKKHK